MKLGTIETGKLALGCMSFSKITEKEVEEMVDFALSQGITLFDHADFYGEGESERIFGRSISKSTRDKLFLQSKCGIRPGLGYDFSKKHIISAVEGSLSRLQTDYLDVLLLHRPDTLMECDELSEAFSQLAQSGKVRQFGVSNHSAMQMEFMNSFLPVKLVANQVQLSLAYSPIFDSGLNVNIPLNEGVMRDGGLLDYCRMNDIVIQAWSPFKDQDIEVFIDSPKHSNINKKLEEMGEKYGVSPSAMAFAWINRHPAKIQTVVGTTKLSRLKDISTGIDVVLSREDWYQLYLSTGRFLP